MYRTAPHRTAPHRADTRVDGCWPPAGGGTTSEIQEREREAEGKDSSRGPLMLVGSCVAVTRDFLVIQQCPGSFGGARHTRSSCCGEESLASVMAQVRRACMARGWRTLRPRRRGPRALRPGELPTRRAALTRNPTRPALRRRQNPSERAPAARPDAVWLQQRLGECQATDEGVH